MSAPNLSNGSFEIGNDTVNSDGITRKNNRCRIILEPLNFAERYKTGDLKIHLHIGIRDHYPEGEFLFCAIPAPDFVGGILTPAHENLFQPPRHHCR